MGTRDSESGRPSSAGKMETCCNTAEQQGEQGRGEEHRPGQPPPPGACCCAGCGTRRHGMRSSGWSVLDTRVISDSSGSRSSSTACQATWFANMHLHRGYHAGRARHTARATTVLSWCPTLTGGAKTTEGVRTHTCGPSQHGLSVGALRRVLRAQVKTESRIAQPKSCLPGATPLELCGHAL